MFLIALDGKEDEGAYAVLNSDGKKVIFFFQEEDDAVRYAMMLEEAASTPVERGYIYLIPKHKLIEVQFDAPLRQALENSVTAIRQMVEWERMPPPAQQINRCVACEFRRFCNDVGL